MEPEVTDVPAAAQLRGGLHANEIAVRGNSSAVDAARMQLPVMTTDQMRRYLVAPQQVEGLAAPPHDIQRRCSHADEYA